ncbi:MAG: hypothetical protein DI552_06080 [Brevundimonas sp.]|jgi:hypothetical protein|uniref:Transmembrane protein n=1 Tax=Brevundimonas albigilva TaxID=1312364 RepID=A0ABY4SLS6_9CAUL|nr:MULTISPECIES: hypothetical protein [Brevundimonas]MCV0414181.1 hypothetical protein [Brevundimonas sp.]PZU59232.1 MAG: hypothetical protein DI552_06080 [Brevundimonas sp.]UQV17338.1 hypothetical protein MU852_10435 [Brevundimonas albigilva]URI14811.1 hypothetical protein M8231_13480 [Brevundimonas albigilva]
MLIAIPLLLIPVVLYNVVVLFGAGGGGRVDADALLRDPVFSVTMTSGAQWTIGAGDMILFVGLILLFFELVKSTSSQRAAIINHALSMVLFIAVLIEFLLLPGFATSTFFLIVTMVLLDVLAGFIVTIIASRKDFDLA